MLVIACYDVNTETRAGRRRLRRVAKVYESTGQRVLKSVFQCTVNAMALDALQRRLLAEIDPEHDRLRPCRLADSRSCEVHKSGKFKATDFQEPLVLRSAAQAPCDGSRRCRVRDPRKPLSRLQFRRRAGGLSRSTATDGHGLAQVARAAQRRRNLAGAESRASHDARGSKHHPVLGSG
jgi:CRISPR-associated protein Cas2